MASLSRYSIRIGIVFALVITVLGLISSSSIVSTVQSNIDTISSTRTDYLDSDNDLLDSINEINIDINDLLSDEIQYILTNYLTGENIIGNPAIERLLLLEINQLNDELGLRQNVENYDISQGLEGGLFNLGLIGSDLPETSDIIDDSETGAKSIIDDVVFNTQQQVEDATDLGEDLRDDYESATTSLFNQLDVVETSFDTYQASYSNFTNGLYENGTVDVISLLEAAENYNGNVTSAFAEFQLIIQDVLEDPVLFSENSINSILTGTNANLESLNQTLFGQLNSGDLSRFQFLTGNSDGLIQDLTESVTLLGNLVDVNDEIEEFITNEVSNLQGTINSVFGEVYEIIRSESNLFNVRTAAFLRTLRSELNDVTFILYSAAAAATFIVFSWIFIVISRSIGRILNKNLSLAEGDLNIETQSSYSKNEMGVIEESLDQFAIQIRGIIKSAKEVAEVLAGISEELAAGAEEASASINEVSSTVRQFSSGSSEQNLMLGRVRDELMEHLDVVEQTSNRIDDTAKFVLRVAKRTNILGLNASIEAAKAGRFGLGFDIVAQEVRTLSNETRDSANQIASNIEEIEFNIRQTVEDILDEVNIIREVAENTASGSEEASIATQEQVTMMNEVSETSNQLSELSAQLNQMLQNFDV